ncbi:hypothetical protein [Anaerofustis stercorihominis]|uniref:hypothetical protein n=1 Tax=Anaerofustis stercorihominis TaxID=214853 RepID=UPI0039843BC8
MNAGYKEESFNQKNQKLKRSGNRLLTGFLLVFFLGYFFFFTSKIWMPAPYEGVEVTPFGTAIEGNDRTVTIDNWTYSKEDKKMEVIISIDNMAIDGIESYKWNIKSASANFPVKIVMETNKLVVLQINNVPNRWTELALTMNIKDKDIKKVERFDEIKIYTNDKLVKKVAHIKKKSPKEYEKEATQSRIESYQEQLRDKQSEQRKAKIERENTIEKMKELKEEMDFQTELEQQETQDKINTFMNEKDSLDTQINENEKIIQDLKEKITIQNNLLKNM